MLDSAGSISCLQKIFSQTSYVRGCSLHEMFLGRFTKNGSVIFFFLQTANHFNFQATVKLQEIYILGLGFEKNWNSLMGLLFKIWVLRLREMSYGMDQVGFEMKICKTPSSVKYILHLHIMLGKNLLYISLFSAVHSLFA